MRIFDLLRDDSDKILKTAVLLHENFEAWPTIEIAINEVKESLTEGSISRILVTSNEEVIGWIGGKSQYSGNVWELHPLVVHISYRNMGFGKLLVSDLEEQVALRGGITIILGTDDEYNQTNLSNRDLYSDVPRAIKNFQSKEHPAKFYRKLGFMIVGVVPDANGFGKPDILMAKRVEGKFGEATSII